MKSWFDTTRKQDTDRMGADSDTFLADALCGATDSLPDEIVSRLEELTLLYDLPFPYLVPRADMLPPESIRFFFLDEEWIFSLLDGALSLGRDLNIDLHFDRGLIGDIYTRAARGNHNVRLLLQGKEAISFSVDHPGASGLCTGFLLRSALVKGWRGLEFKAFDQQNALLTALRIETLSGEVLLGLFLGELARLEIQQPPEGLHFGLSSRQGGEFEKKLRGMASGSLDDSPGTIDLTKCISNENVLSFSATAKMMKMKLANQETVDSAIFALQMIQNPYTAIICEDGMPD